MKHMKHLVVVSGFLMLIASFTVLAGDSRSGLSLETRVAAQKAIEDVYWKHTIWPSDNPQPKPGLDAVLSDSDIRFKTEEYVRKSSALEWSWYRPITAEDLQAEIDRMAEETRDAAVLRELWAALGNDPLLVAECLARPALVDRLTQQLDGFDERWDSEREDTALDIDLPSAGYRLPEISGAGTFDPFAPESAGPGSATTTAGAPSGRYYHTAIWTGTQMIVWGGYGSGASKLNTGGRYNPSTNTWTTTRTAGAPSGRYAHTAVWTGTQMIVWGGYGDSYFNTGGRYNPSTNTWTTTRTAVAPSGRGHHTAVWTGTQMIVWGGRLDFLAFKTGGRYNPSTDTWTPTALTGAPSVRSVHTAVWTGAQMIVWGGVDRTNHGPVHFSSGARYNPLTDTWRATSTPGAPIARSDHTAVWSGTQMIVWGGTGGNSLNTGGRYNPSTNTWSAIKIAGAPIRRASHTAVWTGTQMIVWGGVDRTSGVNVHLKTGGRYNPSTNTWSATTTAGAPSGRFEHSAVWIGTQMIVWGGYGGSLLDTGGRYNPSTNTWRATTTADTSPEPSMGGMAAR